MAHRVQVAYSTAADGDLREAGRRRAWLRKLKLQSCVVPRQVHGTQVVDAREDLSEADGVVSANPRLALGAYGADCPGVVLAAPDALAVGHCGWRGTAGGMVARLAESLAARSQHPASAWSAFIGPGISGERYEVDAPVLSARTWPAAALQPVRPGHALLDLAVAITADLQAVGVTRIAHAGICTAADDRLHSYRHQGGGVVQLLVAWR
jgi:YfiH family protein